MQPLCIALVPLARTTFDMQLAAEVTQQVRRTILEAGIAVTGPQEMITDAAQAQAAASQLAGENYDLLVILQATFADTTLLRTFTSQLHSPLLFWAVPEPHTGGRLRLNSFCGINLAGHAMNLDGKKFDYIFSAPDDPQALEKLRVMAQAGYVLKRLRRARLGVVGEHPAGLDTCHLDEAELKARFGLQVEHIELAEVFQRARNTSSQEIGKIRSRLSQRLGNLDSLEQKPLTGTLSVYQALRSAAEEHSLDGLAVRCWPEFFTELGCAACGAMSMLTDELLPCSCEADANGTVTQLILHWLSGEQSFGSDLVSIDEDRDSMILWHCGLAPLSMADPNVQPRAAIHSNRRLPLIMEFPLKPGTVTLARLNRHVSNDGSAVSKAGLRLVIGKGQMLAAPPAFSGTTGALRFERPVRCIVDTIITQGLEHHISLTYGNYLPALASLAALLDLPTLKL